LFVGGAAGTAISGAALWQALLREGYTDVSVHGMRSAFSDFAHERTGHSNHTIELSLAHTIGNAVERSYRRGDMFEKRRRLLADWAAYCTTPAAEVGKVLPIGGRR
jgi:hypothetical protein